MSKGKGEVTPSEMTLTPVVFCQNPQCDAALKGKAYYRAESTNPPNWCGFCWTPFPPSSNRDNITLVNLTFKGKGKGKSKGKELNPNWTGWGGKGKGQVLTKGGQLGKASWSTAPLWS